MAPNNTNSRELLSAIGGVSRATGVNIETIRYYERIGLLSQPIRNNARHRRYSSEHQQRLSFIRRARELGFSIEEIKALLGLAGGHNRSCAEIKAITQAHLGGIRQKIRDLKKLDKILADLAARCGDGKAPTCPILEAIGAPSNLRSK
jgi:MerR family mercuric resistance operon transcriptional regulator